MMSTNSELGTDVRPLNGPENPHGSPPESMEKAREGHMHSTKNHEQEPDTITETAGRTNAPGPGSSLVYM